MHLKVMFLLLIPFKLYAFDYVTIQKTNLGSVADEFHHKYNREKKDYLKDLKKWNPKWIKKDIPIGEGINLIYPYSYHLGYGKVEDKLTSSKDDELQLNFGYSASIGTYSQGGSTTRINFKQNSPGTVQVMTTKKMSNHFFSDGSMYLSKIMDAKVSGANNSIAKIPYDFGATLYYGKKIFNHHWGIYGGYDFERFYLFNMQKLETSNEVEVQPSNLHYATLGMKYSVKGYLAKLSTSLVSSASSQIAADISGSKWIIFIGKNFTRNFGVGVFVKSHSLKYDDKSVEATRFGLNLFLLN